MKIEIDQSGKIEDTAKPTVIAFSNNKKGSIIFSANDKRYLQKIFREAKKPKQFAVQTFSTLIYLLLEKNKLSTERIYIDEEYTGKNNLIRSIIIQLSLKRKKLKIDKEQIYFSQIGKTSNAHEVAYVALRKNKADNKIKIKEVLNLIKQIDR